MELIEIKGETSVLNETTANTLALYQQKIAELKAKEDEIKKAILEEMESKNIIKLDNEYLTISYIAPTTRETFDTKKLKKDDINLYDKYVNISPVKSSIRIKVKDNGAMAN